MLAGAFEGFGFKGPRGRGFERGLGMCALHHAHGSALPAERRFRASDLVDDGPLSRIQ